jgi:hypothetical protein
MTPRRAQASPHGADRDGKVVFPVFQPHDDGDAPRRGPKAWGRDERVRPLLPDPEDDLDAYAPKQRLSEAELRDVEPVRRLDAVEDAVAPGNYIFTIGPTGGGKTTFQCHLLRYLFRGGDFSAERFGEEPGEEADEILGGWYDSWDRGDFPRRSRVGRPTVFRFRLRSLERRRWRPIDFGFLEVSGEDYAKLTDLSAPDRILPQALERHLAHPGVRIVFVFVCLGGDVEGADRLFSQFLDHLSRKVRRGFEKRASAALVIADPQHGAQLLADELARRGEPPPPAAFDKKLFVRTFLPQTHSLLSTWRRRYEIGQFSVGRVIRVSPAGVTPAAWKIAGPQFTDAKAIFAWIYRRFTGRTTGPSAWARLVDGLER